MKHRRIMHIARAKQLFSFIAYNNGYESKEIAKFLGQHRTTPLHNIKTLGEQIAYYSDLQDLADKIVEKLDTLSGNHNQIVTYGWIRRSDTGLLAISVDLGNVIPNELFPKLTYETGPVKVKIKVTLDENEKV